MKFLSSILYAFFILLVISGCSGSNGTEVQNEYATDTENAQENTKENETEENSDNNNEESEESYNEADLIEAVETGPVYPEVDFQNINWFFGSPDRQPNGGIWVYTAETIPSGFDDTVDWETKDLLLVQVNDPKYVDHEMEFKALQILEDDVVKIVVSLEPDEFSSNKEVARRYASVEKGQLEGKKFIVETVESDKVDVGLQVKTSEISGSK